MISGMQSKGRCGNRAYLANQLHVTVLNTVVDHLDIVTSTLITNPLAAWLSITLGGDALEDILDIWPGLLVSTGHQGRTESGTLLTTGNTATNETDSLGLQVFCSAVGVWEMRVTTINDDITLLNTGREESLDEVVDGLSGHNQEHHSAGSLELGDEVLDIFGTNDRLA